MRRRRRKIYPNKLPPLPNPENQARGRRSRAKGRAFEDLLDASFAYCRKTGAALIEKTPEPMKVIRSMGQGRFLACYTKSAQPDYKGTVKGGRAVMFEAKYTEHDRITQDAVNEQQSDYLTQAAALGARCYVVVGFSTGNVYRVPWSIWITMKQHFGRKYATEEDLKPYQVQPSWNGTLLILN